jgi:hypothetical protein
MRSSQKNIQSILETEVYSSRMTASFDDGFFLLPSILQMLGRDFAIVCYFLKYSAFHGILLCKNRLAIVKLIA